MDQFPLYSSTRQMEIRIIQELLKDLGRFEVEYPKDLLAQRKVIFASQIDETKKTGQVPAHPVCS